jgi:hypothetical protein
MEAGPSFAVFAGGHDSSAISIPGAAQDNGLVSAPQQVGQPRLKSCFALTQFSEDARD